MMAVLAPPPGVVASNSAGFSHLTQLSAIKLIREHLILSAEDNPVLCPSLESRTCKINFKTCCAIVVAAAAVESLNSLDGVVVAVGALVGALVV